MDKADNGLAGPSGSSASTSSWKPWGLWASLAIVLVAEVTRSGLGQINPLRGAFLISTQWAWPLLVVLAAVWFAGAPVRAYLAWVLPRAAPIVFGIVAVLAAWLLWWGLATFAGGQDPWGFVADYRAALAKGTPAWWYLLHWWPALLYAPFVEETLYRGFLWRGVSAAMGDRWALAITSLCFAAIHYNYYLVDGSFNPVVFVSYILGGAIFGWVRWRSGSTIGSMIVHCFDNAWALGLSAMLFAPFVP